MEGVILPKASYPGLLNTGNRNYTIVYNPGGVSFKTSLIGLLGDEMNAITISSNVVAKGQDAVMFMLTKALGDMEMKMLMNCRYSNPPPTDEPEPKRDGPYQPIIGATYLEAHYSERIQLKDRGARWDDQLRKWYVPQGVDVSAFARRNPAAMYNSPLQRPQRRRRRRRVAESDSDSNSEEQVFFTHQRS